MKKSISLLLCLVFLFSCKEMVQSIKDTFDPKVESQGKTSTSKEQESKVQKAKKETPAVEAQKTIASPIALQQAENSLRNLPRFTGKNIIVYRSAHFYPDGRIKLNILDPNDPTSVDRYTYKNGNWQEPEPIQITRSDDISNNSINLDKAPFIVANRVYDTIIDKLKELQTDQTKVTVYYVPYKGKLRWFPTSLNTDRSRYAMKFNQKGQLISFKQD